MDVNVWAQQLIAALQEHMDTERDALSRYRELAEEAPDPHVRFIVKLILEDEMRHHQLFAEMSAQLRTEMEQRGERALPDVRRSVDSDALARQTKELLAIERDDIKELRGLRKELQKVADTAWWSVLVDVMESDNRKHIRLLEFLRDNA